MADNPEVWNKLADAIAEKVGDRLYERGWSTAGIEERLDKIDAKLKDHDRRFDNLDHAISDLRGRHEIHAGEFRKVNKRLDSIDGHLGINTDTRRRA